MRPAILSAAKWPLLISLRKPDTPMLPSGNASCAATSSRSGVLPVIVSGDGICGLRISNMSHHVTLRKLALWKVRSDLA